MSDAVISPTVLTIPEVAEALAIAERDANRDALLAIVRRLATSHLALHASVEAQMQAIETECGLGAVRLDEAEAALASARVVLENARPFVNYVAKEHAGMNGGKQAEACVRAIDELLAPAGKAA